MSQGTKPASPPAVRTSFSTASPSATVRPRNTTRAPSAANRDTIPLPMPRVPPVTSATLPSNLPTDAPSTASTLTQSAIRNTNCVKSISDRPNVKEQPTMALGVDDLYAAARARTGLRDLHEAGLGDRAARLLEHIDTHPALDDAGKRAGFDCVLEQVSNRALLLADRERYPEITEERIERPVIVTGLPRSGTTLMQSLLAEHPGSRTPLLWEVVRPSPPVGI